MTELGIATERLKAFIERIESLETEKAGITADIGEIYSEAKATGLNVKAMRRVVTLRKMDRDDRNELDMIMDIYMKALEDG